jgi:hypothetical protein
MPDGVDQQVALLAVGAVGVDGVVVVWPAPGGDNQHRFSDGFLELDHVSAAAVGSGLEDDFPAAAALDLR